MRSASDANKQPSRLKTLFLAALKIMQSNGPQNVVAFEFGDYRIGKDFDVGSRPDTIDQIIGKRALQTVAADHHGHKPRETRKMQHSLARRIAPSNNEDMLVAAHRCL